MENGKELVTAFGNYGNEITMTRDQAASASHQGRCDDDVAYLAKILDTSGIDPETLRKELKEYGAWTDEQLSDHQENVERWIWLCASDIKEGNYDFEDED